MRAQYLDLWPTFAQEDGEIRPEFSDDRLHLSEQGYEAWLSELRPAIDRLDDAPPMSGAINIVLRAERQTRDASAEPVAGSVARHSVRMSVS